MKFQIQHTEIDTYERQVSLMILRYGNLSLHRVKRAGEACVSCEVVKLQGRKSEGPIGT